MGIKRNPPQKVLSLCLAENKIPRLRLIFTGYSYIGKNGIFKNEME
ncbi:MAG: hypothetical protein HFI26_05125 [Lachnospiraceae bacterium]|jgi:hypothetical protein|nr:hypothetical protein [Lachnospiraceae bacterium]